MAKSVLAAQFYTLREFTRTPADIRETMKKVAAIGYEAVQLSALGPIDPMELKKILDGEGLAVCATHTPYYRIRDDMQKVIEEHLFWGCTHVAIGCIPDEYKTEEGYYRFAKEASEVGRKLAEAGLVLSYHNHSFELQKFGNRTALDILYWESDPSYFNSEIDTYWIQHGGGDPAAWIRKLKGRAHLVHFKDMAVEGNDPIMAEVGEGNLNWDAILEACRYAEVQWYIVEQDICKRDPFESLAISLRNLREMGLK